MIAHPAPITDTVESFIRKHTSSHHTPDWYTSLRDDQKQFILQLRYSIAPTIATKEYLEEMLRELCDVCDQSEKDLSMSQDEVERMQGAVKTERERLAEEFYTDKETTYTGYEVAGMLRALNGVAHGKK